LLLLRDPAYRTCPGTSPRVTGRRVAQAGLGDVVLVLAGGEPHQVQAAGVDEMPDVRGERRRHRGHQRRGGEPVPPVPDEERGDPGPVPQPGLVQVEEHPVDRLDLE
jgi:hypothetical protein